MARKRLFNIAGPCNPQEHYMLDPMRGLDKQILSLIEEKSFFVIHAARQSGKTTLLQALVEQILEFKRRRLSDTSIPERRQDGHRCPPARFSVVLARERGNMAKEIRLSGSRAAAGLAGVPPARRQRRRPSSPRDRFRFRPRRSLRILQRTQVSNRAENSPRLSKQRQLARFGEVAEGA